MSRKIVSVVLFALILTAVFSSALNIRVVRGSGDIYIKADGSIDPSTANITSSDNVTYTFTDNIYDSIYVERDNIIIDGDGHTLNGSGSLLYGFNLTSVNNMTITNVNIVEFGFAIWLKDSFQCVISNNTCTNNEGGIWLVSSAGNMISGNNIIGSITAGNGIYLRDSYNITISGNGITAGTGIYLRDSYNITISGNGITTNEVNGIVFYNSNCSSISGNDIAANNGNGVYLYLSINNIVSGNNIKANNETGIFLHYSSNITVSRNNTTANERYGTYLYYSSNNTVSGNNIKANKYYGVYLYSSSNNTVSGNNITNNQFGVRLAFSYGLTNSLGNIISRNNITNNECGIFLYISYKNSIYYNNFINNTHQVYIETFASANVWDKGYPSGGNYWDDYTDTDQFAGPYQNITGSDGIWDHPYVIDENNQDNYPLIPEFPLIIILPLFMVITLLAALVYRRSRKNKMHGTSSSSQWNYCP